MILETLKQLAGSENVFVKEMMNKHTSFRVGGPADYFVTVTTIECLSKLMKYFSQESVTYFCLGNGSNLLVSDKGFSGVILKLAGDFCTVKREGCRFTAGGGVLLSLAANRAKDAALSGMEFASGIPGSLGGAIVMNAGAYGGEMSQIVEKVRIMDENGDIHIYHNEEMEFGYRHSILKRIKGIVVDVTLCLRPGNAEEIKHQMDVYKQQRQEKQPLEYPSAGSTFKRPEGNFAGKLIMDAGLKGFRIGDAAISEKHAGFLINYGSATATDIKQVMAHTAATVKEKFGIDLEPEVIMLGDFE